MAEIALIKIVLNWPINSLVFFIHIFLYAVVYCIHTSAPPKTKRRVEWGRG